MEMTLLKIVSLALVDAINPCAFAVMIMILVSILVSNPEKRHRVLTGGLSFSLAVFTGYFIYGLIIIQLFKSFIMLASSIRVYLTTSLAIFAIFLGIFNIKDFISYKPGGFATEMPLSFRPRVKLWIKKIASPFGAFVIGIFVTLFLLPCTMGPYIIAGGDLSELDFLKTIPWLVLYNLIFILPMIAITLIVYFGISTTEKMSDWKERKIKYIHLIAGLILIGLGIGMITGLIK